MQTGGGAPPGREIVWATAVFAALTLVLAYPLSVRPGSLVLPLGGDTRLLLWMLGWDVHALTNQPWAVFDANIFAPERLTLAYSENCLGSALLAAPVLWASGNPVLAMNVVVLVSCVLCGIGTYMLARQLGLSPGASLVAGVIFSFAPPRFLRLGQLHLAPVQWIPFCLTFLHRYWAGGKPRDVKLAAIFFTLQVMTSGHAGLFLIASIACLVIWRALRREPLRLAHLPRDLGVVGVVCAALLAFLMLPYAMVRREHSWVRTIDEARVWSPNAASFLESPSHVHRALRSFAGLDTSRAKAALFPGVLPLILAPIGVWALVRDSQVRARLGAYVLIAVVSLWLALGPDYGLYALAYQLPASNFIRVPSRYVTLALLALAVIVAQGVDLLSGRLTTRPRMVLVGMLVAVLAAEFAVAPLDAVPYDRSLPQVDRWLATRPAPFTVAEVPVVSPRNEALANSRQSVFMMHSTAHWQRTVHGYSGFEPPGHTALFRELVDFPDDASLARLRQFGVDYVVVHASYYRPGEWEAVRGRLAARSSELRLIYNDGESRVYALKNS